MTDAPNEKAALPEDVVCPFCKETEFDLIGLKLHINNGHCDKFNDLEVPRGMFWSSF